MVEILKRFEFDDMLLVLSEKDETVLRSCRNIPGVTVIPVAGLNVYDILRHKNMAATTAAIEGIQARLGS